MKKKTGLKAIIIAALLGGTIMFLFGCGKKNGFGFLNNTKTPSSGTLGDNSTWTYDKHKKTLFIDGKGDMDAPKFPWNDIKIEKVVFSDDITSISRSCFYGHHELTGELKLPKSLKKIEDFAFYGCGFKGDLVIPEGVEEIGSYAFRDCEGFDGTLTLPSTLKTIGDETFGNCSNFTGELKLPDKLEHLGRTAFSHCSGFTGDLILPDSLTFIGDYTFNECSGLDGRLHISTGLTTIPASCFCYCENLKGDLFIPDSVTSVEGQAFVGCKSFDGTLTIPDGITKIEKYSFSHCENLKGEIKIPSGVEIIDDSAFSGCEKFTSVSIPEGVGYICEGAFLSCKGLSGELKLPSTLKVIGSNAFAMCTGLTGTLKIPENVTELGYSAFSSCKGVSRIELPDSLLSIGTYAFYDCTGLKGELTIPGSVTYVGEGAFMNVDAASVRFGSNIRSIGEQAFYGCNSLKKVSFAGDIPDYYDLTEKHPSFPEGCMIETVPGAKKRTDEWAKYRSDRDNGIAGQSGGESESDDGAEKEVPYYWTDSLSGTYRGSGEFADVTIEFGDNEAIIKVNDRDFDTAVFDADANSEDEIIYTEGLYIRDGHITNLRHGRAYGHADVVVAEAELSDGTVKDVIFYDGSPESVYIGVMLAADEN